jgi:hypothetical protein
MYINQVFSGLSTIVYVAMCELGGYQGQHATEIVKDCDLQPPIMENLLIRTVTVLISYIEYIH